MRAAFKPTIAVLPLAAYLLFACSNPSESEQPSRLQDVALSRSVVVEKGAMRFDPDGTRLVLDFVVIAGDTFHWVDPSDSPFAWQLLEQGNGRLVTRYDGEKGALFDVTEVGDAVHLESGLTVDVDATPNVLLELTGRSLDSEDSGNQNTQEFFFKTGPSGVFTEFVMYDMGGASGNPPGPDRGCGSDQDTPYNRDQLSTRSRIQDTQCWDGFANAPIDWRSVSVKSMAVDFGKGTADAYLNENLLADLDEGMGETIRSLANPVVWIKNVDKGGAEDLLIDSITLYDGDARETDGYVVVRLPVGSTEEAVLVRPAGVFPAGSLIEVELSESPEGPYVAQLDPLVLTPNTSNLFIKIVAHVPSNAASFVLTGLRIEFY